MDSKGENKLLAVIRVRGRAGIRHDIKETLERLNLRRINNLSLVFGTKPNLGMVKKCNDFITYGEINEDVLQRLLEKKEVKATKEDLNSLMTGKKKAVEIVRMPLKMKPPRRGYEGIKKSFGNQGALGNREAKINELIKRML